jgi:hypothetical protein
MNNMKTKPCRPCNAKLEPGTLARAREWARALLARGESVGSATRMGDDREAVVGGARAS